MTKQWFPKTFKEDYQNFKEIGSGHFGSVFRALEKESGTTVAIKCINCPMTDLDGFSVQEIDILLRLVHPNVVRAKYARCFLNSAKDILTLFIIMELADDDLLSLIESSEHLDRRAIYKIFYDICCGVEFLHSKGIYHMDLKPKNILVTQTTDPVYKYTAKVGDFSAALYADDQKSADGIVCTKQYTAPEVLKHSGKRLLSKADSWGLGIILLFLLIRKRPFDKKVLHRFGDSQRQTLEYFFNKGHVEEFFNVVTGQKPEESTDSDSSVEYQKRRRRESARKKALTDEEKSLITRLLDYNPKTRMSVQELVDHPIFKPYNFTKPTGQTKDSPSEYFVSKVHKQETFDAIITQLKHICNLFNTRIETYLLTCDLMHRSIHFFEDELTDIEIKRYARALYCVARPFTENAQGQLLTILMYDMLGSDFGKRNVKKVLKQLGSREDPSKFSSIEDLFHDVACYFEKKKTVPPCLVREIEKVRTIEVNIPMYLTGCVYPPNLFHKCRDIADIVDILPTFEVHREYIENYDMKLESSSRKPDGSKHRNFRDLMSLLASSSSEEETSHEMKMRK